MVIKQYFRKIQGADILITRSVDVFPDMKVLLIYLRRPMDETWNIFRNVW